MPLSALNFAQRSFVAELRLQFLNSPTESGTPEMVPEIGQFPFGNGQRRELYDISRPSPLDEEGGTRSWSNLDG